MSNLTGLPPAAVARATQALTQDLAVRLINLPESLQNNSEPLALTGVVKGQAPDGSLQVETQRGIVNILLKDRGNLPAGQKIEIDIPAGKVPQQAAIRLAPATAPSQTPHLASYLEPSNAGAPTAASLRLDRTQPLNADDVAEALATALPAEEIATAAPLQVGQILRLIPIASTSQAALSRSGTAIFSPQELFTSLMSMISQATDLPIETRQNLVQILSRIDIATLLPPPDEASPLTPQQTLQKAFQTLVQETDLPATVKLQNAPLQNTPLTVFNSARPLDVRILAFENTPIQNALNQVASQVQIPIGPPLVAPLVAKDFLVLPQPAPPVPPTVIPEAPVAEGGAPPLPVQTPVPAAVPPTLTAGPAQPISTSQATPAPLQTAVLPEPQIPAGPPSVLGQVIGFTPQGQPVISLALPGSSVPHQYAIQFFTNNVVEGTPIIVSPLPAGTPVSPKAGIVPFPIGSNQSLADWVQPDIWDSLQTLVGAVAHLNPAIAQTITQMLPNAANPQTMPALSMFLLSVMRTGDLDTWIGDPAISLLKQSGKIDVLRALAGESMVSNRLEATQLPNDWRATMLPFWHNGQVDKLPLYYKHWNDDNEEAEARERRKKMRFMFELKLSRMGSVQVDGFMQRQKLDMILRTKAPVGPNMQEALRKLYYKAMERSNLSGEITFQFKPEQWVHIDMPMETLA